MKKVLALFLAVLMLMSTMTLMSSAVIEENGFCVCYDHTDTAPCRCCLYCDNLDTTYVTTCCKKTTLSNGDVVWDKCCTICTGLKSCTCDCTSCCESRKDDQEINDGSQSIIPSGVQNSLVAGFQNAMKKLQQVFDNFFDAIFEFLRFDDFFG